MTRYLQQLSLRPTVAPPQRWSHRPWTAPFSGRPTYTLGVMARGAALTLPWLAVLAISASVAYGATIALTGGGLVEPHQVVTTVIDAPASTEACDVTSGGMVYVGLNTWIPISTRVGPCAHGTRSSE